MCILLYAQKKVAEVHNQQCANCLFNDKGCTCGAVHPEHVVDAVRHHFDRTAHPSNLHLYTVAAVGDGKGRGLAKLAAAGLVIKYTFGW